MVANTSSLPEKQAKPVALFLLMVGSYLLPTMLPGLMGWVNGLLALPVFFVLIAAGQRKGTQIVRSSILLAAGIAILLFQRMELFLFSLTMLPLGYAYYRSAVNRESPAVSGCRGVAVLAASWIVFWVVLATWQDSNPYQQLIELLDAGFAQTYQFYSQDANISAEHLFDLELVIKEIRAFIPRIMPGLLCCTVVLTAWMNLVGSSRLTRFSARGALGWPPYSRWSLPDQLVWIAILAAALTLAARGTLQDIGISLLLLSGLVYFFQGLAVFIHLLNRWNTPPFLRIALYLLLAIQTYGLVLLAIVGVADVWGDFRKLHHANEKPEEE